MIKIVMQNLQAIASAEVEIEERSITEFVGNNSNGKSILAKVIQAITSGDIRRKEVRQALIKDGTSQAVFAIGTETQQMAVVLGEEIKDCSIVYIPQVGNPDKFLTRALSDKQACDTILHKFGFRVYAQGDICLQLSPTFGAIPFITTSGTVNGEIVTDIITDKVAQEFLDSFKSITFPTFRTKLNNARREKEQIENFMATVAHYDWQEYERLAQRMSYLLQVIDNYKFITVDDIDIPPLGFKLMPTPEVKDLLLPLRYVTAPVISNLDTELDELIAVYNGVCPTCGRRFFEHEVEHG